jgi:opacity protein-like surface antigen
MRLRRAFTGAVALAASAAAVPAADLQPVVKAPATEPQQATGYLEVYGGWAGTRLNTTFCDTGGCDLLSERFDGWALGGAGRVNYWIGPDASVQLDAQAEGTSYDASAGSRFSNHSFLIGGHWSWRRPQLLLGLFAAAGDAGGGRGPAARHGVFGAEAQWYWSAFTLYLQGGYDTTFGNVSSGIDDINAWFVRATGRYYVNPSVLIELTGLYASGDASFNLAALNPGDASSLGFQIWLWQAKAEWRLPTAPFSVFVKYQGSETRHDTHVFGNGDTSRVKVTDNRVVLGLKLHMGDRSLWGTDRGGATLDIIDPLSAPTSPLMFAP